MSGQIPRKAIRYQLAMEVSLFLHDAQRCLCECKGVTRNISSDGALIATDQNLQPGEIVEVAILLPRLQGQGHGMKLLGEGAVLRVNPRREGSQKCEFAIYARWRQQRGGAGAGDLREWIPTEARLSSSN